MARPYKLYEQALARMAGEKTKNGKAIDKNELSRINRARSRATVYIVDEEEKKESEIANIVNFGKGLLTIAKLSKASGIGTAALRKLIAADKLKKIKVPYSNYIRYSAVQLARVIAEYNLYSNNRGWQRRSGYVYLLAGGGFVKIGKAKNVKNRREILDLQLPFKCELIHKIRTNDCKRLEDELHKKFDSKKANGEWFKLDADDIAEIKKETVRKFTYDLKASVENITSS